MNPTRKLKQDMISLENIRKMPSGNFSKKDTDSIEIFITNFRESAQKLSQENRNEFETNVKNYKNNLNDLIDSAKRLLPLIELRYKHTQAVKLHSITNKNKKKK